MTSEADRYRAPALDKGLDILELLAAQPHGLTRAEIVKAMGRSPSEIYRMLERLVAREYVLRSVEGDRYSLSLKLYVLGHRHPPVDRLVARAQPLMDAYAKAAEQSCHLSIYDRGNLTVVAQTPSPGNWGMSIPLGARVSLIDTGSGHAVLAFQTPQHRSEMLAAHVALDGEVPIERDELDAMLEEVRRSGLWLGESKQAWGVTDISIPVMDPYGEAMAVLTSPYVRRIDRHIGPDLQRACDLLKEAARGLGVNG